MTAWPVVPLGTVIDHRKEFIQINDVEKYRRPRVQLHAQGIVLRDNVPGAMIKTKKQQFIRAGQFLVAEIDAKVGGFGIVPHDLDGAIVSSHYFLYDHRPHLLDNKYLGYFIRTRGFRQQVEAQGSTNYAAIRPTDVLNYGIPLPSLEEQARIAARIEELATKIGLAQTLRHQTTRSRLAIPRSILNSDDGQKVVRLRELVWLRAPDIVVQPEQEYQFAGVYSFGRGVFRSVRKMGSEFSYPRLTRIHAGNFVYPKLMAWEGALGVVPTECDGMVVSTEFPVFEVDDTVVVPEVLDTHFRSPEVWTSLSGQSGGTNVRRRRLNPQEFLNLEIRLPSKATQNRLVDVIRRLADVGRLQTETAVELNAMLPAILDKAFNGKL